MKTVIEKLKEKDLSKVITMEELKVVELTVCMKILEMIFYANS